MPSRLDELLADQAPAEAAVLHELIVGADLDDPSAVEDQQPIADQPAAR